MSQLYWRQSQYDYLDEVIQAIVDGQDIDNLVAEMSSHQIKATFRALEDPYSHLNWGQIYRPHYWVQFKEVISRVRPELTLP